MDNPSHHGPKIIHAAIAQVEEYDSPASSAPSTKVIQVSWIHPLPSALGDGEWNVSWKGMNEGQDSDEGYGSLISGNEEHKTSQQHSADDEVTHRTDGLDASSIEAMDDSLFEKIFQERNIVQTPTRILPPLNSTSPNTPNSSSQKLSAFFLLSHSTPAPASVTIRFTPIWTSPIAPSPTLTVPVKLVSKQTKLGDLHKAWGKTRLVDLHELQQLADELARTGQRGVGIGSFKVGVDGGGHDEERLKWEAEMVRRERNWVLKTFLGKVIAGIPLKEEKTIMKNEDDEELTEQKEIENGLEILAKLAQGLKVSDNDNDPNESVTEADNSSSSSPKTHPQNTSGSNDNDEEEDDLFALPLSPRSPEIGVSPFSFRGPAIGNLDATIRGDNVPLRIPTALSVNAIPVAGGVPLTPTLTGAPNPCEMRKKRLANPGVNS